ncbi:MAG: alpha/beta fold hydrolase [Jatrophihabitantaceae bacterium]
MTERVDVTVASVRLACYLSGPPGGPALVLLHALGEQATSWDDVRAALDQQYRVLALDLRGHGASDWPGEYSFELMYQDVLGVLDELGLGQVSLVGHSMGGSVAYLIAQRHPDRIERLVIEDVCPAYDRERPQHTQPDVELPFDWPVVPAISGLASDYDAGCWDALAAISAPTLIVAGGPKSQMPQAKLDEVTARIPDCRQVVVPAGHHVHAEDPAGFIDAVRGFLLDPVTP